MGISASHLRRRNVLIETYWNVKTGQASGGCTDWFPVLIETYWNVNSFPAARNMASVGINRNILECKYGSQTKTKGQPMVLIETYWNVNLNENTKAMTVLSINRNILECKSRRSGL